MREAGRGSKDRGIALVLTLLIVAVITAMVVEFAYNVYVSTNSLYNWETSEKLSLVAKSAVKLGPRLIAEKLLLDGYTPGSFEMSQKIPFDDPGGAITLRIEDENAKFNLNCLVGSNGKADTFYAYPAFVRLLAALKLNTDIADRITDWIDSDSEPRLEDSEKGAKNGHLDSVDELLLIPGIDRETYDRLRPYVTIYGSSYENMVVNINGADVPVLMSLSDSITKDMAEEIIRYREATPFSNVQDILGVPGFEGNVGTSLMGHIDKRGISFRIVATAESGGIKRIIECVTDANGTVQYWKEM